MEMFSFRPTSRELVLLAVGNCRVPPCKSGRGRGASLLASGTQSLYAFKMTKVSNYKVNCAMANCSNWGSRTTGILYHRFPKNEEFRRVWVLRCNRSDKFNPDNARVCSIHFRPQDYERDLRNELLGLQQRKILRADAVPSLFIAIFHGEIDTCLNTSTMTCQTAQQAVDTINEKLFGVSNSLLTMRKNKEAQKSVSSYHTKENTKERPKHNSVHSSVYYKKMPRVCFVCDELVVQKAVALRYGLTHFSSTALPTKLGQLMGDGFMVVVADSDVLCARCFGLLNRLDKMEMELDVVRKVLCDFLKSKYHLGQACDGLALESLQRLDHELDATAKHGNMTNKSKFGSMLERVYNKSVCESRNTAASAQQSQLPDCRRPLREVDNRKETSQSESEEVQAKRVKFSEACVVEDGRDARSGSDDVQNHIVVVHDYSDCEIMEDDDSNELFTKKLVYSCATCGYENSDKATYEAHLRCHMNIGSHKCKICHRKFPTKELLEKHTRTHKTFKCEVCDEIFMSKVDLLSHSKCHNNYVSTNYNKSVNIVKEKKTAVQDNASVVSEQVAIPVNCVVTAENNTALSKSSDVSTQEKQIAASQSLRSVVGKLGADSVSQSGLQVMCKAERSPHANDNIEACRDDDLFVVNCFGEQPQQEADSVKNEAEEKLECYGSADLNFLPRNDIFIDKKGSDDLPKMLRNEPTPELNVSPGRLLCADDGSSRPAADVNVTERSTTWGEAAVTSGHRTTDDGASSHDYCDSLGMESKSLETAETFAEFKNSAESLGLREKQAHFELVGDKSDKLALQAEVIDESTVDDIDTIARMKISELFEGNLSGDKKPNETGCVGMVLQTTELSGVSAEAICTTGSVAEHATVVQ